MQTACLYVCGAELLSSFISVHKACAIVCTLSPMLCTSTKVNAPEKRLLLLCIDIYKFTI